MSLRHLIAASGLAALGACASTVPTGLDGYAGPPPEPPAEQSLAAVCTGDAALGQQMTDVVNATRSNQGKTLLEPEPRLNEIAVSHACDMARRGRLDVAGSNGSNVVDRARAVGYPTCGVVQLVGRGAGPSGVVSTWLGQRAQREQVLGQLSYQIGSGAVRGADGQVWYSVVLGNNCR